MKRQLTKKINKKILIFFNIFLISFFFGCQDLPNDENTITDEEKVQYIISNLYVPEISPTDVGLISESFIYPDVSISWRSLEKDIISDDGKFIKNGEATLEATIACNKYQEKVSFPITLNDKLSLSFLEEDFNNFKGSSKNKEETWSEGVFSFQKANLKDQKIQIYSNSKDEFPNGIMEMTEDLSSALNLSFDYQFVGSVNSDGYYINLEIEYSLDQGETWSIYKTINYLDEENHQINYDISNLDNLVRFRFCLKTNYRSDRRILIDNFKIDRRISREEILNSLEERLLKRTSKSIIFPKTTAYGGVINWESSFPSLLSETGLVRFLDFEVKVRMTARIEGFSETIISSFEIIVGPKAVVPVEIFFIDIGKYGQGDTGEAFYIKIEDFDILVDAGEASASFTAIKEVIDDNSNDLIIDYLIATHPDADHIGNMPAVFQEYQVLNLIQFYGEHTTQCYQNYKNAVLDASLVTECSVTDSINNQNGCKKKIDINEEVFIEIIDTKNYTHKETNSRSIVFVLEAYGTRTLFTGDADNKANKNLEADYMFDVQDIDILKVVHHGAKAGTSSEFLAAVAPEVAIITNGNFFGNRHGHPTADVINRIYQYNSQIKIYAIVGGDAKSCTLGTSYKCDINDRFVDRNGTIKIVVDDLGYQISTEYQEEPLELSSTYFWITHPERKYQYQG